MKKTIISSLLFLFCGTFVYAQNSLRPNLYLLDMSYYNPASILSESNTNRSLSLYGKYKLIDNNLWSKAPNILLNYMGKLQGNSGLYSASYLFDNYSFFNRHAVSAGYTYRKYIQGIGIFSFGGKGVFNFDKMRWNKISENYDKPEKSMYFNPDLDLGVLYQGKRLTVGLAVKNIFANTAKADGENLLKNEREWVSNIAYVFSLGTKVTLVPYTLIWVERNLSFDIGLHSSLYKTVHLSYHLRTDGLRNIFGVGVNITSNMQLSAAFDHSFTQEDNNLELRVAYRF